MAAAQHRARWEQVNDSGETTTERMRVPGGWLYRTILLDDDQNDDQMMVGLAMVFVPGAA